MYVQYFSAITNASLGNGDLAVSAIDKAVELGYPTHLLALDAGLATLADDDRLKALFDNSSK